MNATKAQVTAAQKNVKAVLATVNAAQATVAAARANGAAERRRTCRRASLMWARRRPTRSASAYTSGFSRVVAPFAGVITARNVDVGTLINAGGGAGGTRLGHQWGQPGQRLYLQRDAVHDAERRSVRPGGHHYFARVCQCAGDVRQADAARREGESGDTGNFPDEYSQGEISNVSGAIDAVSRTLLTEVRIPNQDGTLLPGMYAQVHFDLPKTRASLRLPSNTLMYDAQGTRVATLTPDNKIHIVPDPRGPRFRHGDRSGRGPDRTGKRRHQPVR